MFDETSMTLSEEDRELMKELIGDVVHPDDLPKVLSEFRYIGKGLTADQFTEYVRTYDFGLVPPDFVVLHHSAVPSTAAARYASGWTWDTDESGMSDDQIYHSRLRKLAQMRDFYKGLGWDRAPHLYIDDRYIWLFSPMSDWGIHAMEGNHYNDARGYHYSIGIEVVGFYGNVAWPEPVARLVGHAVAVLKDRLNTFEIVYKPGPRRNPAVHANSISSHRDYNKPECPGGVISEDYYIGVICEAWERLKGGVPISAFGTTAPPATASVSADSPILSGTASGTAEHAVRFVRASLPGNSEYQNDVETILGYYWTYAPHVGVDPMIAAGQCIFETDGLKSGWAARPKRNPAGLGVRQEGGLSFENWESAVQAHIGQLLAFALTDNEANDAQRQMMARNPRHAHIPAQHRGTAKTLAGLNNRWTDDADYASKLANRIQAIIG